MKTKTSNRTGDSADNAAQSNADDARNTPGPQDPSPTPDQPPAPPKPGTAAAGDAKALRQQIDELRQRFHTAKSAEEKQSIRDTSRDVVEQYKAALPPRSSPDQWHALDLAHASRRDGERLACAHAAASALHGWRNHEHYEGRPMRLTRDDYDAALEAVGNNSRAKHRTPKPHDAAKSPHRGKRL